eukprot:8631076-Alexandrium_andersonii.AAC.1
MGCRRACTKILQRQGASSRRASGPSGARGRPNGRAKGWRRMQVPRSVEFTCEALFKTDWLFKQLRIFRIGCSSHPAKAPPAR